MSAPRLITIAIHTCEKAIALKKLLEVNGVEARLQNINLEHPQVSSGMRVRISESDLPKALLVVENEAAAASKVNDATSRSEILVPVDFSDYSTEAAKVAYQLAKMHKAQLTLLHAFTSTRNVVRTQLTDVLTYDSEPTENFADLKIAAEHQLQLFIKALSLDAGDSVAIKSICLEGIPEEVITHYVKENTPLLIVMGTRGADKKEQELVGSVTAEVLDTCRRPVLTIPEGFTSGEIMNIDKVMFLCRGEQNDILALQRTYDLFGRNFSSIVFGYLRTKRWETSVSSIESLAVYCAKNYPKINFSLEAIEINPGDSDNYRGNAEKSLDLIVVSNKRKSAFARLFNPGIAHRLLFNADIPMIVIPI